MSPGIEICEKFQKEQKIALGAIEMIAGCDSATMPILRVRVKCIYGRWLIKALANPLSVDKCLNKAWKESMIELGGSKV